MELGTVFALPLLFFFTLLSVVVAMFRSCTSPFLQRVVGRWPIPIALESPVSSESCWRAGRLQSLESSPPPRFPLPSHGCRSRLVFGFFYLDWLCGPVLLRSPLLLDFSSCGLFSSLLSFFPFLFCIESPPRTRPADQ